MIPQVAELAYAHVSVKFALLIGMMVQVQFRPLRNTYI